MLNTSDRDKFVRIAITLDRYKMLAGYHAFPVCLGEFTGLLHAIDAG